MALFKFVERIERGDALEISGEDKMSRDFTYVDDLVRGVEFLADPVSVVGQSLTAPGTVDSLSAVAPGRVVNIAGGSTVGLMEFVEPIGRHTGIEARKVLLPMQTDDVPMTRADPSLLKALTGFEPRISVHEGACSSVEWYRAYRDAA